MNPGRRFLDQLTSWSPVLLLGGLAALTFWLDAQVQKQTPRPDGSKRHDPDLYVERLRATSFDTEGRIQQSLAAARAEHFPDTDGIDFVAPAIVLTEPGKPRYAVSADAGSVTGNREEVTFRGNVRAVREPAPGSATSPPLAKERSTGKSKGKGKRKAPGEAPAPFAFDAPDSGGSPITITTQWLRIVPKQGRADTPEAVTIEESRGIIRAVGMEFDNQARTLKLKSQVRGTIQPPPPAK